MESARGGADTLIASYLYAARYGYSDSVLHNDNQLRIFPLADSGQEPVDLHLWTRPPGRGVEYTDRFGNRVRRVRIVAAHDSLIVASAGRVRLATARPQPEDADLEEVRNLPEAFEYTARSPLVDPAAVSGLADEVAAAPDSLLAAVSGVAGWVHRTIRYRRGTTGVTTTADQVLRALEGVCQDKAHLALALLRALGIPSRYVSGLLTGEVGETHAWVEVRHPRRGWLAVDPTRGLLCPPPCDYVKLAVGRDYADVPPVAGSFLSRGAASECAAVSTARLADAGAATLADAMELLRGAYVVSHADGRP
jgi:transglutaminase-like putative cysteine protease